ncbi:hypothetical protein [Mycolicibacterium aubagnense]|uniref:hypothetical protein n=1 Tax=Mycolicibacterium aubagnense TaxID=319707 RepID=UPI001F31EFA8|nr:hypothetical protein [Mycolicibacterium aubagnense]WGI34749.1 hypothetical protein QDT91_10590 [Mycolicibacterium aubagnense]
MESAVVDAGVASGCVAVAGAGACLGAAFSEPVASVAPVACDVLVDVDVDVGSA